MRDRLALVVGKTVLHAMKLRKGGSSLRGMLAHKISPKLLSSIKYPELVIAVTGTNGKTSTANLLADIFRTAGYRVAHNTKGANMLSGLTTAIIAETRLSMKMNADVVVLEIDEASVPLAFRQITAQYLLITNFFRDQLERYGELETVIAKVSGAITEDQILVVNGNDPLTRKVALDHPKNEIVYFGVDKTSQSISTEGEARESKWCPVCNKKLHYDFYHYSQIGRFDCENCSFATPELQYEATNVNLAGKTFTVLDKNYKSGYDNLYFLFNIMGSLALASEAGISLDDIHSAIANFEIGDGRMEKFFVRDAETFLNLVKNPAGLNQTISHIISQPHEKFSVFMALNNQAADSIDTSWIWDASLEKFNTDRLDSFICSGDRAYDLAVRLENAGVEVAKITVLPAVTEGLSYLRDNTAGHPFVLTNYTPLQPIRRTLASFSENQ